MPRSLGEPGTTPFGPARLGPGGAQPIDSARSAAILTRNGLLRSHFSEIAAVLAEAVGRCLAYALALYILILMIALWIVGRPFLGSVALPGCNRVRGRRPDRFGARIP
jgi:hypothetical protein